MSTSRDDRVPRNRVPLSRVNIREQPGREPRDDYPPSPPPHRRGNAPVRSLLGNLNSIVYHSLGLFSTILGFLTIPLAAAGSVILALYLYRYLAETIVQTTCSIPGSSYLPICIPIEPKVRPLFAKAIKQEQDVAYMQKMASDNAALPYTLLSGQTSIKDVIFQISAIDLPSKKRLMPKVDRYNTLLEQVVDSIQDAQIRTDTLVDNTISTYNWAEDRLEEIYLEKSSLTAPLKALGSKFGITSSTSSNEETIQKIFHGYTERLYEDADDVVMQYLKTRGHIVKFRDLLKTLALDFKQEEDILDTKRLDDASYWKWILRSHRQKMKGYDKNMELCARFYKHLMEGEKVIAVTHFKMQEMRGRVRALRDELRKAPLMLHGETKPALKLTIDMIRSAAAYLDHSRTISHMQQKKRIRDFEKTMA